VTLVDTSAWIDFFQGRSPFASVVDHLLELGEVAICGPIETEIRRGIRSKAQKLQVLSYLEGCEFLKQPENLWIEAGELGFLAGRKGVTIKTLDLLIATYAIAHETSLLTKDSDFELLARTGIPLRLEINDLVS